MTRATFTALAAASVLGLAACGGGDEGEPEPSGADKARDGALAFARCMRENGVDMPDPRSDGSGRILIGPGPGGDGQARFDPSDPTFRKADEACRKHLEAGFEEPGEEEQAEMRDAFVKYARCMREEGIDLPDPDPGGGGFRMRLGDPDAPDLESPAFKEADGRCGELLSGVGPRAAEASP